MKYEVRIQNPHARDIVLTDIGEDAVGKVVTEWCGSGSVVIVTLQEGAEA